MNLGRSRNGLLLQLLLLPVRFLRLALGLAVTLLVALGLGVSVLGRSAVGRLDTRACSPCVLGDSAPPLLLPFV